MTVAIIERFPEHGFEVWITDWIEIGAGMGDVFATHNQALKYAVEHDVPTLDLSGFEMPILEGKELQDFMQSFLELSTDGAILSINKNCL